jgi:murein DD-endopeptidase MepM/ murein hydrolase activator NlpD
MSDMEDIIIRSRYPRHNAQGRRRRKNARDESSLAEIVIRQVAISVLILVVLVIVKAANTPVTNFLSEKIKSTVFYNMDVKAAYAGIEGLFGGLADGMAKQDDITGMEENSTVVGDKEGLSEEDLSGNAVLPEGEAVAGESTGIIDESEAVPSAPEEKEGAAVQQTTQKETSSRGAASAAVSASSFIIPVGGKVGSPYGYRDDPFTGARKFHRGIDIEANKGASIKAAMDGEVAAAGSEPSLGNYVKLQHKGGYATIYAHCSVLQVKAGQKVKQGSVIAKVGDTGRSIGAHLHFEIWKDGKSADPMKYVSATIAQKN